MFSYPSAGCLNFSASDLQTLELDWIPTKKQGDADTKNKMSNSDYNTSTFNIKVSEIEKFEKNVARAQCPGICYNEGDRKEDNQSN